MMETIWDKVIKIVALLGGAVAGIFGEWSILLTVLAVVMILDYMSGILVAAGGHSLKTEDGFLDSKAGFRGLAKKGFIVIMVLLATVLDRAIANGTMIFQTATASYYVANEALSILENAALMGLPVPGFIQSALEQMREQHDANVRDTDKYDE